MNKKNTIQSGELKDQLAEITETMQREKIEFTPEMKVYFDETLARFTEGMTRGEMPVKKDLDEFVNKLKQWIKMSKEYRERYPSIEAMDSRSVELITEMKLEKSYDEMVDTLQNYGYTDKIPEKESIMGAIINLGPSMLEKIKNFNRPTILITPKGDLASKIQKLDSNKKYLNQGDTYFANPSTDTLWGPTSLKHIVTIVDGSPEMPKLLTDNDNHYLKIEEKHQYLTDEYKNQGMKMISAQEYAMLAQKSLRSYELSKNSDEIIDQNQAINLNAEHLTDLQKVPYVKWFSDDRRFHFDWDPPAAQIVHFRGRPSVQVIVT